MSFLLRQPSSGVVIEGDNDGDSIFWNATLQAWEVGPGGGGAVASVFGRTGAVVAATGDYDSDQVDNVSGVSGSSVSDALDALAAAMAGGMTFAGIGAQSSLGANSAMEFANADQYVVATSGDFGWTGSAEIDGTASSGMLTKIAGPTREALVVMLISLKPGSVNADQLFGAAISYNGDRVGTSPADANGGDAAGAQVVLRLAGVGSPTDVNGFQLTCVRRIAAFALNDTVQPIACKQDTNAIGISALSMVVFFMN